MFQIIDLLGNIHDAYGAFRDKDGDIQFVLCDSEGNFYTTHKIGGYYKLYTKEKIK